MNFGTKSWNLRKAVVDRTFADRLMLDLNRKEEEILPGMKPKTRYNIRLSWKKGVRVRRASPNHLPDFYELHRQTADRNGFQPCEDKHFAALFPTDCSDPDSPKIIFLLSAHHADILAGAIVVISGRTATYLFGASSNERRNVMAPYAVQWAAMHIARAKGCLRYDLGAVSPGKDPAHPFFGLY